MPVSARLLPALALTVAVTLAGCGGSAAEQGDQPPASSPTASPTTASPADGHSSAPEAEDDAVEVEVEVEDGQVTPSGERVDVQVGQTIRFVVDSDAADEIHVHSVPEHTFRFGPGTKNRELEFKITQPGVVEAELHELGDVIVTIAARP